MLRGLRKPVIDDIEIEPVLKNKWRKLLDLITQIMNISAALIMSACENEVEVFVRSSNEEDIRHEGERAPMGTGLYCETVINTRSMLEVTDAIKDEQWHRSAGISLGLNAYLGFPVLWPDGEVFGTICVLEKQARTFSDSDRKLLGLFAQTLQDDLTGLINLKNLEKEVREHLKDETELRVSEERFQKIIHSSPSAMLITAYPDGGIIDANESFMTLFGVTREQMIGKTDVELGFDIPAEQKQAMFDRFADGPVSNYPLTLKTPSGESKRMLISIEGISIKDQECVISTMIDITPVWQLEQNLKTANERFALATRAGEIGIWDSDIASKTIYMDERVAAMYGLSDHELTTTYEEWAARIHPADKARSEDEIQSSLSLLAPLDTEHRVVRPDGSIRYIKCYGNVLCGVDGEPARVVGVNMDITERKLSGIALQKSETRLKRAQALAHVGNWEINLALGKMWASEEAFRIYGIPYEDEYIPLETAQKVVADEDRPMMDEALAKLMRADADYDVVFHIRRQSDAAVRALHSVAELEYGIDGKPLRIIGVVQDVTEQMQAQRRIAESEQAYKALFNENPAQQLVVDAENGKIIDVNPAAVRFYGYSREAMVGKSLTEINGLPIEVVLENLRLAYDRKKVHYEVSHQLADGRWREVEAFSGRVHIGDRKCVNYIIHDITDRKSAEAQLRESEARFRHFVENAPDSVFVQAGGCFAYVNQKTLQLLGAESEEQLLGQSVLEFFAEEYRAPITQRISTLNESCQPVPMTEEAILRMDGSRVEVEVSAVPIQFKAQNGALVFMRDITARRVLESEKTEMEAQLRQKQRLESIGLLAGGVAHEINNPLNGIINYAQLILEGQTDEVPEYSREIIREGKRIGEIVRNLLKFSRQEKQSHSPACIEDIVNETLSLIRTLMRHDQIAIEINIPPDLPSIKCRSQQIQQVLMNLFTNARDALNARYSGFHEDKVIRVYCILFERADRRWIRLTVEDRGTGIPDAIRDKIFDPFFTTKPRDQGTGLGLSISHGIAKDHHGELIFETEPGEYTRAILELPVDNGWNLTEE